MSFKKFGPSALILVLSLFLASMVRAGELAQHPGYLSDTSDEKYQVSREVVIVPMGASGELSLRDKIFSEKITKEFKRKYEERFGRTQAEQVFNTPSQFFETEIQPGVFRTADEVAAEQRKFGNYMIKRTVEHHVDRWMKESPSARPVYELKEKISNVNVEVRPGYKARIKYSLSSNEMSVNVKNPHNISNRLYTDLSSNEVALFLGYPVTKKVRVQADYNFESENYSISGIRRLNQYWSASITGLEAKQTDPTLEPVRQAILGLSWRD
jgi:hypothetical protein